MKETGFLGLWFHRPSAPETVALAYDPLNLINCHYTLAGTVNWGIVLEHRGASRRRVFLPGLIVHGNGAFTVECTIKNLSTSGARLAVNPDSHIPERFQLLNIRDGIAYDARIVRNELTQIAVTFDASNSLAKTARPEFHTLRQLWLAKTTAVKR